MIYELCKASAPGWVKEYECEYDARQELLKWICKSCLAGSREYIGENGEVVIDEDGDEPPDQNNIHELLSTACGCEFMYEEYE
jgi:hypothetical protein